MAGLTGRTLGKYRVLERLGRGGMADIYKAYHPRLDRHVAIKVLHPYLAEGRDFVGRFEREARAVAALRHPHIVQVYDFDVEDELYYMVMEFVRGETLKSRLEALHRKGEYLALEEAARILGEIADALEYAHQTDMLHRDVKPSNVLLDESGRAFLTDFGIARILSSGGTQYTATGALIGTPAFMSPEQGKGLEVTRASDVYSLGVILYQMVTGRVPFDADTPLAVIHKQIHDPLPIPTSLRPDLPEAVERVILKALAKAPEDRYQSAQEMSRALDRALRQAPGKEAEAMAEAADPQATPEEPKPAASLPTVAMKESSSGTEEARGRIAAAPTVAMDQAEVEEDESVAPAEQPVRATPGAPEPASAPPLARRIRPRVVIAVMAGIAAVAIAVALLTGVFPAGAPSCATVEDCVVESWELMASEDEDEAAARLERARELVPEGEHPPAAHLWCAIGEASAAIGRVDEARSDFEHCIEWTEGDPGLEGLRHYAEEQLMMLEAR